MTTEKCIKDCLCRHCVCARKEKEHRSGVADKYRHRMMHADTVNYLCDLFDGTAHWEPRFKS